MSIVAEQMIGELIRKGLIKEGAADQLSNYNSTKWKQLKSLIELKYEPEWLNYASVTKLRSHDQNMLRLVMAVGDNADIAEFLYPGGLANAKRVLGRVDLAKIRPYNKRETMDVIGRWQSISRGRDLFIPGYGTFNIAAAIDIWDNDGGRYKVLPDPIDLLLIGYLNVANLWRAKELRRPMAKLMAGKTDKVFEYIMRNPNLVARYDELKAWRVLNPGKDYPSNIVERLDDLVRRDLRVTAEDHIPFEYERESEAMEKLKQLGFVLPKNGIDLKQTAQIFKNCAGGYVKRIANGSTIIMYRPDAMIELNGHGNVIKQAYGPMNQALPISLDYQLREILAK